MEEHPDGCKIKIIQGYRAFSDCSKRYPGEGKIKSE